MMIIQSRLSHEVILQINSHNNIGEAISWRPFSTVGFRDLGPCHKNPVSKLHTNTIITKLRTNTTKLTP